MLKAVKEGYMEKYEQTSEVTEAATNRKDFATVIINKLTGNREPSHDLVRSVSRLSSTIMSSCHDGITSKHANDMVSRRNIRIQITLPNRSIIIFHQWLKRNKAADLDGLSAELFLATPVSSLGQIALDIKIEYSYLNITRQGRGGVAHENKRHY